MSDFYCPIYSHAQVAPDAPALVSNEGSFSYAHLNTYIATVQAILVEKGVIPNARIAVLLSNSWQYVVLMQALFRIKAVVVPVSTRFPDDVVEKLVLQLKCKLLVVAGNGSGEVEVKSPVQKIHVDDLVPADVTQIHRFAPAVIDHAQHATILFSSGSTGLPKAILHNWGNHYYSALGSNENIALVPGDRWLLSLPLYHVAGVAVLFRCFLAGATVVLPTQQAPLFDELAASRITHVSMVSTQLLRVMEHVERDGLPDLKSILLGGSAISRALIKQAKDLELPIHTSYGMTEMASQVTTTPPGADLDVLFTSGRILSHREVRLDEEGQILLNGSTRFLGYVTDQKIIDQNVIDQNVNSAFDASGWYATGDLGRLDEHGNLLVLGRKDNMFISGGENIHPEEIERALEQHAEIIRAVVVPIPDREYGFRPVAFITFKRTMPAEQTIEAHLAPLISRYMRPLYYFELTDEHTSGGMKISRKGLAEWAVKNT